MTAHPPPTRVLMVRHGTAEGADGVAVGQVDLPLSSRGAEGVQRLARSWGGAPPARLIASDLRRARSTAEILAERWTLDVDVDPRLREMDFGDWDGRPWKAIREEQGVFLEEWMRSWWRREAPGGESLADVARRASQWLDELLADAQGETVVAVGHGGSIRTALCHVLELPLERAFHLRLDHGQVTGLVTTWRGVEVEFLNAGRFPRDPSRG